MKTDWISYTVQNNPEGANSVLQSFGYEPEKYEEDLDESLRALQLKHGEEATMALLKVHPDRNVLQGMSGKVNSIFHRADGDQINNENKTPINSNQNPYNQAQPIIITSVNDSFGNLLLNTILVVMAFWTIKEIIFKH
jgi:hypothetical protein